MFRVRATTHGQKPHMFTVRMKLDVMGIDLIAAVGNEVKVVESRLVIFLRNTIFSF